jgi:hypothetical protein
MYERVIKSWLRKVRKRGEEFLLATQETSRVICEIVHSRLLEERSIGTATAKQFLSNTLFFDEVCKGARKPFRRFVF